MTLLQSFRRYLKKHNIAELQESLDSSSIIFRQNNLFYVYLYDSDNPYYFRLLLPRIADYRNINEAELNKMALKASAEYKIAKFVVIENQIWASFEQIILDADSDNSEIYDMGIRILAACYQRVRDYLSSHSQNPSV